jgi:RNA polymerase sigma-70 factor (ECF subfamily)
MSQVCVSGSSIADGVRVTDDPDAALMDESSRRWLDGLRASGSRHDQCVAALHELLVRVARHEASRRAGSLQLAGPELEDIAQQASDDALMAIKGKLADFRGESRFTTWAYGFVMFEVSTKIGRHFWRNRQATLDEQSWERLPDVLAVSPHENSEHREMFAALRRAIDEDLTPLQRKVFVAIALNEVPMDAFAHELGSTRNAVYKVLHDARRRLRGSLAAAGYERPRSLSGAT